MDAKNPFGFGVVWVRVSAKVFFTEALHKPQVASPDLRPVPHVMVGWVVNRAGTTFALRFGVHIGQHLL